MILNPFGKMRTQNTEWIPCYIYKKYVFPFERHFPHSFLISLKKLMLKQLEFLTLAQRKTGKSLKTPHHLAGLLVTFHSVLKSSSYSVFHPTHTHVLGQILLNSKCKAT
jgi:hypothetical protein